MGVYDEIALTCPYCGEVNLEQSKYDECLMRIFDLENAPPSIIEHMIQQSPISCIKCDKPFEVIMREYVVKRPTIRSYYKPEET